MHGNTGIVAHWSDVEKNPNGDGAVGLVREHLKRTYRGRYPGCMHAVTDYVTGRSVLDIGVVAHSREFIDSPEWKHREIKRVASRSVGCDILPDEVAYLQSLGFDVRLVDATSSTDLGERFETAYIGDVIEHVNDPIKLMQFAAKHLASNGQIVVVTPCPFWWKNLVRCLSERPLMMNVDHLDWITPFNAVEIGHRASLELVGWHLVQDLGHNRLRRFAHHIRDAVGLGHSELFSWGYVFIYARPQLHR